MGINLQALVSLNGVILGACSTPGSLFSALGSSTGVAYRSFQAVAWGPLALSPSLRTSQWYLSDYETVVNTFNILHKIWALETVRWKHCRSLKDNQCFNMYTLLVKEMQEILVFSGGPRQCAGHMSTP